MKQVNKQATAVIQPKTKEDYYKTIDDLKVECDHMERFRSYPDLSHNSNLNDKVFLSKKFIGDANLFDKYKIGEIACGSDTLHKTLNIMQWLTDNTLYSGMQSCNLTDKTDKILQSALKNDFEHAINCRLKAIVLTDLLLSAGIIALPISLHGFGKDLRQNKDDWYCHFMVHVLLKETGDWVVVDPSFNTMFESCKKPLNIFELRECLRDNVSVEIIGYNFNGSKDNCFDTYRDVFIKASLEFISTWKSNSVKRKSKGIGKIFTYYLQPCGDKLYENLVALLGGKSAKNFTRKIIYIGKIDLLEYKE